jgi:hypothetical protein
MSAAASRLGHVLGQKLSAAAAAQWLTSGKVTALTGTTLTVDLHVGDTDATPIEGVHCLSTYSVAVPKVGDVVLLGVLRGASSVEYIAIDKIVP